MAGFAVRIDDLRAAAAAFARLRVDAEGLLAANGLGDSAGMAGRDPVLAAWRTRYDAVAAAEWAAATTAVATLGAIATKLAGTADSYLAAEHDATGRLSAQPKGAAGGVKDRQGPPAQPPSSTGAGGPEVPDALAAYYPGGEPERLRAAGARWVALAEGMSRVAGAGDDTFRRLAATGDGIAFSAMRAFWARRFTPCATDPLFNAVVTGSGVLGDSCRELADLIEHTRAAVRGAAAEAVADMEPLDLPARLLGKLAWNVPELELLVGMGALAVAYLDHYRDAYLFSLDRLVERLSLADEQRLRRAAAPDPPVAAALADVGRVAGLEPTDPTWDTVSGPHPTPDAIHVTPQRATHILHSDHTGGGHAPGTGRPGQSEFPRGWSDQRILAATLAVARAPEVLRRGRYGRWVAEGVEDGVRIRVVVGADGYVFTSVPLSGPGVIRNPGAR
jgi:hypothetical protein